MIISVICVFIAYIVAILPIYKDIVCFSYKHKFMFGTDGGNINDLPQSAGDSKRIKVTISLLFILWFLLIAPWVISVFKISKFIKNSDKIENTENADFIPTAESEDIDD